MCEEFDFGEPLPPCGHIGILVSSFLVWFICVMSATFGFPAKGLGLFGSTVLSLWIWKLCGSLYIHRHQLKQAQ